MGRFRGIQALEAFQCLAGAEALTNIVKHPHATTPRGHRPRHRRHLHLEIEHGQRAGRMRLSNSVRRCRAAVRVRSWFAIYASRIEGEGSSTERERARHERQDRLFAELAATFWDPILRYCLRHTRSSEEAHEVVQDTFLRLYELLQQGSLEPVASEGAYRLLITLARRTVMDHVRRGGQQRRSLERLASVLPEVEDRQTDPVAMAEDVAAVAQYRAALAQLTEREQRVITLLVRGESVDGIAEELGVTRKVAVVSASRARQQMRRSLAIAPAWAPRPATAAPSGIASPVAEPQSVILKGRIAEVGLDGSAITVEVGRVNGEVDTVATVPIAAVPAAERDRVRPGAFVEWSLEQWVAGETLHSTSRFHVLEGRDFTEEQRRNIEARSSAYGRLLGPAGNDAAGA